jgi:ABC-2 type transport system ATP-binding protein
MEEFGSRYLEVVVLPAQVEAARALGPLHERQLFGRSILLYERGDEQKLSALGEVRRPSIADVFVAMMSRELAGAAA